MAEYYKTLDDVVAAVKTKYDSAAKAKINSYNADIDKATAIATQNAAAAEETTKKGYEDVFRKNRLNQIINEEKTKERMANLGLTDSGLNRTQQTAIQLQAANADAAAVRNRQAAVDEIRRGITEFTAQQEAKKSDYARETNDLAHQNMMSEATSIWNTQLENQQKAAEAKQKAYDDMMEKLNNTSLTGAYKASIIQNYADTYNNGDPTPYMTLIDNYGFEVGEGNVIQEKKTPSYSFVKTDDKFNWFGGLNQRDTVALVDNNTGKIIRTVKIGDLNNVLNREQRLKLSNDIGANQSINISDLGIDSETGINNLLDGVSKKDQKKETPKGNVSASDIILAGTGTKGPIDHKPENFLDWLNMLGNAMTYNFGRI